MRYRTSAALSALLALTACACDILTPATVRLQDQIRFLPVARERLQMLVRWWPFVVANLDPLTTPVWGAAPFTLPIRFPGPVTTPADAIGAIPPPNTVRCDGPCILGWQGQISAGPWSATVAVTGSGAILGGAGEWHSREYGLWGFQIDASGAVTGAAIRELALGKIFHCETECTSAGHCSAEMQFRQGMTSVVHWTPNPSAFPASQTTQTDLGDWSQRFPWVGAPQHVFSERGMPTTWQVSYANAVTTWSLLDSAGHVWLRGGPGAISASGAQASGTPVWSVTGNFPSDQVLHSWSLTITLDAAAPAAGIPIVLHETRVSRRGERTWHHLELDASGPVRTIRWSEAQLDARIEVRPEELGWRISGFFSNRFGALLKIDGTAFVSGIWMGSFEGWNEEDSQQPSESGDWTMLPDGTFAATFLFRQADDSFTEIRAVSPPEGAAATLFEVDAP